MRSLFSNDSGECIPMSQCISRGLRSSCFRFVATWFFQVRRLSKCSPRYVTVSAWGTTVRLACLNEYIFILLDLGDHTDLSEELLCILQCRVVCVCVCFFFVRLVWKWLLRQVGRASPFPCCLNLIFSIQWWNLKQFGPLCISFKAISSNIDHNFVPVLLYGLS